MAGPQAHSGTPRWMKVSGIATSVVVLLVIVALFAGSLFTGAGGPHGPARHMPTVDAGSNTRAAGAENAALTVTAATVGMRPLETAILATGTVVAWEELPVAAEVSGLAITEVLVDEGDRVKRGQLLVRLNDIQLQAQIEQQKASISEAQANFEVAQAEWRRGEDLVARKVISEQNAEVRAAAAKTAAARLVVVRAGLVRLNAQLAQTGILAPADGYISKRSAVLGQVVQTGAELLRIVRDGRLEVDAKVPESDLFAIAPEQPARVTDPAGRAIGAQVRAIAPIVDPRTRLGIVHVVLPAESELKPGMFARVEIMPERGAALAVPQSALVWRSGQNGVFTIRDGTVSFRPVKTGLRRDGWVQITDGLAQGDQVAVAGAGFLKDGDRVRVELAATDGSTGEAMP